MLGAYMERNVCLGMTVIFGASSTDLIKATGATRSALF